MKVFTLILLINTAFASCPKLNLLMIKDSAAPLQINVGIASSGILLDFLNASIGKECEIQPIILPFKRMIKIMNDEAIPHWINYGGKEWGAPQAARLSKTPIIKSQTELLTLKENKVNSIKDMFGKTVVLITGFNYPGLEKYIEQGKIKAFYVKDYKSAVLAVQKKRGYGFVGMDFRHRYTIKHLFLNPTDYAFNNFNHTVKGTDIYVTFSRDFPEDIKLKIDKYIQNFEKTNKLEQIINKYTKK